MNENQVVLELSSQAQWFKRLVAERSTCRAFLAGPVPLPVIENIVDTARRMPSWCNTQPWQAIVTRGDSTESFRQALKAEAARFVEPTPDIPFPTAYAGVYGDRRREAGVKLYQALGIARDDKAAQARQSAENFRLFGAPHVAILTVDADLGAYAGVDCGAFIGAFLLAAQAHGVATAPQAALVRHAQFIHEFFKIGGDHLLVCGISFGFANRGHPANGFRTNRAPLADVLRIV